MWANYCGGSAQVCIKNKYKKEIQNSIHKLFTDLLINEESGIKKIFGKNEIIKMKGVEIEGIDNFQNKIEDIFGKKLFEKYKLHLMKFDIQTSKDKLIIEKSSLVKKRYKRNNYFAENYYGKLFIPKGDRISSVYYKFGSVYDNYTVININNGIVENRYTIIIPFVS